jgi:amidase
LLLSSSPIDMTDTWETRVSAIKAHTLAQIPANLRIQPADLPSRVIDLPSTSPLLTPLDRRIVHLDATDLRDEIAQGKLTAVQVIEAYIKTAALAHQATNCLTDFFPGEARERAEWLDERMRVTGKPVGPLHGVPISVKVSI